MFPTFADKYVVRVRLHWSLRNRPILQSIAQLLGTARPAVRYATCPSCTTTQVRQLVRRDPLDRFIWLPWTLVLMLFGGRIYHCGACQAQFYDCRKQSPASTALLIVWAREFGYGLGVERFPEYGRGCSMPKAAGSEAWCSSGALVSSTSLRSSSN